MRVELLFIIPDTCRWQINYGFDIGLVVQLWIRLIMTVWLYVAKWVGIDI